jgi:hypothetical protein
MPKPPGGQCDHDDKGDAIGQAEDRAEIRAPEMIEANIKADAEPAAIAMRTIAIISCPAPFERLEVFLRTPTIGNRTTRKPYEDF